MNSLLFSLFLIFYVTTITTLVVGDRPYGQCDPAKNGVDIPTAVDIKATLIDDLKNVVPTKDKLYYCNTYESNGVKMFGYAECTRMNSGDLGYCTDCLGLVGEYLKANCDVTGIGYAWDDDSSCYVRVGFNVDICPVV
ncbi:hypothetical protein LINPERPRIM_LOCUS7769 [Linum perenne]